MQDVFPPLPEVPNFHRHLDGGEYVKLKRWIINEDILDKIEIVECLRKDIKDYFELNLTSDVNLSTIWDAFKAVIRGRLINWNSIEKARRNEKLIWIQNEITKVKTEFKKKPGKKKLEKQLKILKQQKNSFDNQEIVWKLKILQQKQFEGANKPEKFLAYQLKKRRENRLINKISAKGKEIMEAGEIKKAFKFFYSKLYQEKLVKEDDI